MNKTETAQQTPSKIKFINKKSDNYPSYYSNGIFGAVTARGDFEMNFFFEHAADISKEQVMNYEKGEFKLVEQNPIDFTVLTRDLQVNIIMSPQQAEASAKWILHLIDEFKKNQPTK